MKEKSTESDRLSFSETFDVRFNEVDSLGIVWHGHYISYFEQGREAFGKKFGISYLDMKDHGFATPIVKSSCEHFLPLKYGDSFRIETSFVDSTSAKMIFRYHIFNAADSLVCRGETVQVFTDFDGNLSLYAPAFFLQWKQNMGLI